MTDANPERVLRPLRERIDALDDRLVGLVAERMQCVEEVVAVKRKHGLPGRLDGRVEEVVARVRDRAGGAGAPPELAELLWRTMIEWIIAYEDERLSTDEPHFPDTPILAG